VALAREPRPAADRVPSTSFRPPARPAAGATDGSQLVLNDLGGIRGTDQSQIVTASKPGQNVVVAWREARLGDGDIRVRMYDTSGNPSFRRATPRGITTSS